jgi:hypothetical protein
MQDKYIYLAFKEFSMAYDVSRLTTVSDAKGYLDNVRRLGRDDLYPDAFRRLVHLTGQPDDDPLVLDFWRAIAAAEEVLRQERGKTIRLARTRQKIARVGVHQTVADLAMAKTASDGFAILTQAGLGDLTAEYLVVKHADRFGEDVIAAARTRLVDSGIPVPEVS